MNKVILPLVVVALSVASGAPATASSDLLPDLGMGRISDIRIDTTSMPGHELLRYGATVADVGAGPLQTGTRPSTSQTFMNAAQDIAQSGGGFRVVSTKDTMQYLKEEWRVGVLESGWLQKGAGKHVPVLAKHWYCPEDDLS
jgi:hypothetical protein